MNTEQYKMYVLVRNDLPNSLNAGKAMAQVHHAGTQAVIKNKNNSKFQEWIKQSDGFGTTLVLSASLEEINGIGYAHHIYNGNSDSTEIGVIIDPTYPFIIPIELKPALSEQYITDNDVQFICNDKYDKNIIATRTEITCMWIFVHEDTDINILNILETLPLHP